MNSSIYGTKTIANDGFEYRSRFEAEFVNKFLIPNNIKYERQKLYSKKSKHQCDFYLPDYDIWIECVYEQYLPKKSYLFAAQDIVLTIPYPDDIGRNRAKNAGAKWNSASKQWIIDKNRIPPEGFPSLERYMNASALDEWFDPNQVNLTKTYNENLKKKIMMYGDKCSIMQINNADLDKKYTHIADLIRIKNNKLFLKLLDEKPYLIPKYEAKTDSLLEESAIINGPTIKPESKNTEAKDVIVHPDGKVEYSNKRINRQSQNNIKKEKLQARRLAEFNMLLNGSTKAELEYFVSRLNDRLAKLAALAERKTKTFPDK